MKDIGFYGGIGAFTFMIISPFLLRENYISAITIASLIFTVSAVFVNLLKEK